MAAPDAIEQLLALEALEDAAVNGTALSLTKDESASLLEAFKEVQKREGRSLALITEYEGYRNTLPAGDQIRLSVLLADYKRLRQKMVKLWSIVRGLEMTDSQRQQIKDVLFGVEGKP